MKRPSSSTQINTKATILRDTQPTEDAAVNLLTLNDLAHWFTKARPPFTGSPARGAVPRGGCQGTVRSGSVSYGESQA